MAKRAGKYQKGTVRRRCEAAPQRDTGKQIGIDPEIEFRLALAAGSAGEVEHGIGAAEQIGLRGDEGAEIALDPFGAVWPRPRMSVTT